MRRYKIVACIILTLSVFGFVHAAPVAVQEVRETCTDAVVGGENVIIGSGKRAEIPEESSSAPNYAGGTYPSPSFSSEGEAGLIQRATSTEIQPASSSKAKSVSFAPEREVIMPSGKKYSEPLPPETGLIQAGTSTDIQPASSSKAKSVSWAPTKEVKLSSGQIYSEMLPPETKPLPLAPVPEGHQPNQPQSSSNAKPVSWKEVQLPSGEIYSEMVPAESKTVPLLSGQEGFQPKIVAQQLPSPLEPQSESIFGKLVGGLKFRPWRRISGTAGGVVTEG